MVITFGYEDTKETVTGVLCKRHKTDKSFCVVDKDGKLNDIDSEEQIVKVHGRFDFLMKGTYKVN